MNGYGRQSVSCCVKTFKSHAKKAFTLAEILVTIGIIGIVAALTIPNLINNAQNAEFKSAFKKIFSTTSNVIASIGYDNGGSLTNATFADNNTFRNLFSNYFSSATTCDDGDSSCWTCNGVRHDDYFLNGTSVTTTATWWYKNRPTIVLKDGTLMNFGYLSSTCQGFDDPSMIAPYANTLCGVIFVDINGCKGPNTWGRDIFDINIQSNKIFPRGPSNDGLTSAGCSKNAGIYAGQQCAEYVIENKDY